MKDREGIGMKKLMVVLVMALGLEVVHAQVLQTSFYFEADYIPTGASASYTVEPMYLNVEHYSDFKFAFNVEFLLWNHFFFGGRLGTVFNLSTDPIYGLQGNPDFMDSLFVVGVRFLNMEIGMQRFCNHPVVPNQYAKYITSLDSEVSWGKFYFRIGGKL